MIVRRWGIDDSGYNNQMNIIQTQDELRVITRDWQSQSLNIALVPTIGNLHAGHMRLVDHAAANSDKLVVSIFVNPTQFSAGEDLDKYPRSFQRDCELLEAANVDMVFAPSTDEIYQGSQALHTIVRVPELADKFCGASRPGHFDGVTTIVAKLFNLVQPQIAVFGEKDYQQLFLIRKMVEDLNFPVVIHSVPTERASDGLALSSRNSYLSEQDRLQASHLYKALQQAASSLKDGQIAITQIEENIIKILENHQFYIDYVAILRKIDLLPANETDRDLIILAAAKLGSTRLIDNISIQLSDTI